MIKAMNNALHFDFHTLPGIKDIFKNFDAEEFAKSLSDAKVRYINFFARCNIGFSYYNTKIGIKYPGLERDILKEVLDACHKYDIGVTAYFNAGLNHEHCYLHPEWTTIDKEGRMLRGDRTANFFRMPCYNTGFFDHLKAEVLEVVENYDVDGIFLDCMGPRECFCHNCLEKMKAEGVNVDDDAEVLAYEHRLIQKVEKNIRESVKKDIRVFFNTERPDNLPSHSSHAEVECLPAGHWGYDFLYPHAGYFRTKHKDLVYMTGRFSDSWGDFGGIRPLVAFENDMFDALCNGYQLSFGDHLHPVEGLSKTVIERAGIVFKKMDEYAPFVSGTKFVNDVAILYPHTANLFFECVRGLSRILCELKIPYNVHDEYGDFSKEKALILPGECHEFDPIVKDKLVSYVKNGGKIIFVGSACNFAKELGLTDFAEITEDTTDNAYFTVEENGEKWSMYNPCVMLKNKGATELARYAKGIFPNKVWDGRHGYFYRPQGEVTDYSAVLVKDNIALICFDLCTAYANSFLIEQKELFESVINKLLTEKAFVAKGFNAGTIITMTANESKKIIHVKATVPELRNGKGVTEDHTIIKGGDISVKGEYKVYAIPENKEIKAKIENGVTTFTTGEIIGYSAFMLK